MRRVELSSVERTGVAAARIKPKTTTRIIFWLVVSSATCYLLAIFVAGGQIALWAARAPWRETSYSSASPEGHLLMVRLFFSLPQYENELLDMLESGEKHSFGLAAARLQQITPDLGIRSVERLEAIIAREKDSEVANAAAKILGMRAALAGLH